MSVMKKDNLIFIHKLLKAIADSIIKVFIPLYILKTCGDLNLAIMYLIVNSILVNVFMFLLKKVIEKWGVISIMLHFIPIVATEAIFSFWTVNLTSVLLASVLMALCQTLYSVPLNIAFAFGDKKTNVAKFQIASNIGKVVFTLISGFILSSTIEHSFLILSISSSIIYVLSVIPLFFIYRVLVENYNSYEISERPKVKIDKWFIVFHLAFGMFQPIMDHIVPLYLFINGLNFKAVTIVIVIVEVLKIAMNYVSQILVKHKLELWGVSIGALLFMSSILVILFVKIPVVLYIFSCVASVSFPLTFVPMFRMYSKRLRDTDNVFNGMLYRDYEIFAGRPFLYALSFIGFGLFPTMVAGVAIVPAMLISEIKLIKEERKGSI